MQSKERKKSIIDMLKNSDEAITGEKLADAFGVTRQIIVRDMAVLKAEGNPIISTARGYMIEKEKQNPVRKRLKVCHEAEKMEDELTTIVDLGGKVLSTYVNHPVYGNIGEALNIKSRRDIKLFLDHINETGCRPLLHLTNGVHEHVIETENETSMEEICLALKEKGYLISS